MNPQNKKRNGRSTARPLDRHLAVK